MDEALRLLRDYEIWIYTILALLAFWQMWKFALAWQELRVATFGLEREQAQSHLNSASVLLVLFLLMAITEFTLVSFVIPTIPAANPLPTPTLNLQTTPTTTLPPSLQGTASPQAAATLLPVGTLEASGCVSDTVMLTQPKSGDEVMGIVTLEGTASIPNFGFYKFEVARPGDTVWLSINAGREPVIAGKLGDWDTKPIPPGEYLLRLVVTDNAGETLPPCVIRLRVAAPATPTP